MPVLGKRARSPSPPSHLHPRKDKTQQAQPLAEKTKLRPRLPSKIPKPNINPETTQPTPLPLSHYLSRGIVPLLPDSPEERFNWSSIPNLRLTIKHSHSTTFLAALTTLIKAGRKYPGTTPGITLSKPGKRDVRYEYWPVFDEHASEDEVVRTWPRKPMEVGQSLGKEVFEEWYGYFHRPAHIEESMDF